MTQTHLYIGVMALPADFFCPGTSVINGRVVGSPWVEAYWMGRIYRYERDGVGLPWVLKWFQA